MSNWMFVTIDIDYKIKKVNQIIPKTFCRKGVNQYSKYGRVHTLVLLSFS